MNALKKGKTYEVVDLLRDKTTTVHKWVYIVKYKTDGSIKMYKARLMAKKFIKTCGIDYQETFTLVAKIRSIRVLSLTVNYKWPLDQLGVKNVFLNGDLEEEIFMDLSLGFEENLGVEKH